MLQRFIVNRFHRFYYDSGTCYDTYWLGVQTLKCPLDMWIYQEIIHGLRPDIIVECGTFCGGSALFLASICDLVNNGRILTIDINPQQDPLAHRRIQRLHGSSTSPEIVEAVKRLIGRDEIVMVILDSDHHKDHVLQELRIYGELVTRDSYLIVEDTNLNGHPVRSEFGPGPMEAVQQYLEENPDFVVDTSTEKFHLTFNPGGYLRRVR